MDDADLRRVNLLECLEEERPALASLLPPESVLSTWSDDELRAFFASDGARRPEKRDASVAGGARDARFVRSEDELAAARSGAMNVDITRPEYSAARYRCATAETIVIFFSSPNECIVDSMVDSTRLAALASSSRPLISAPRAVAREVAFARGIPFRRNGLFPLNDPALSKLSNDPRLKPLQKHFPIDHPPFYECVGGCWATGDDAAASGLDLRYFYDDVNKSLSAVVRFGDGAAIARGKGTSAHGGSIETALDETTAEGA